MEAAMALDPVCKTRVDEMDAGSADYEDEVFVFCSEICKQVFQEDPELFASSEFNDRRFIYSQAGEVSMSR
jgi:YHS domain-containing protein